MGVRPQHGAALMSWVHASGDGDAWGTVQEWRFAAAALLHFGYGVSVNDYRPSPMWQGLGDVLASPDEERVQELYDFLGTGDPGVAAASWGTISPVSLLLYLLKIMNRAAAILTAQGRDY